MTLQDLAFCEPSQLEALSDAELDEICKPFWPVARPELAPKREPTHKSKPNKNDAKQLEFQRDVDKARKLAAQFGIKI